MAVNLNELSNIEFFGNSLSEYLIAFGIFLLLFIAFKIFVKYILNHFKKLAGKTKNRFDDMIIDFIKEIKWQFYIILSVYISSNLLKIHPSVDATLYYLLLLASGFYIAKGISKAINHIVEVQIRKRQKTDENNSGSLLKFLGLLIKIALWAIIILMVLSNMGIEITPLLASLGIGGIAVALALQTILGDLFGAFVIYFDKPFKEGDFIVVGNDMGVVKHIGIKSTRIQALQGQELVMSNTELINSRVNNYKQMEKRRIAFTFGVQYDTGITKLRRIKKIVSKIFDNIDGADLDRVHFKEFGDFSLNYEVVYYVESPDYMVYMNIQEEVNLNLYAEFEKAGIEFAFPTQTIHLAKSSLPLSQTKHQVSKKK